MQDNNELIKKLKQLEFELEDQVSISEDYCETADLLANDIARLLGKDIGEHSNVNCPWVQAHKAAKEAQPLVGKLESVREKYPKILHPVVAKIRELNSLGTSEWYEVVYHDETKWCSYAGSDTFSNGQTVVDWIYCNEIDFSDSIPIDQKEITELKKSVDTKTWKDEPTISLVVNENGEYWKGHSGPGYADKWTREFTSARVYKRPGAAKGQCTGIKKRGTECRAITYNLIEKKYED